MLAVYDFFNLVNNAARMNCSSYNVDECGVFFTSCIKSGPAAVIRRDVPFEHLSPF